MSSIRALAMANPSVRSSVCLFCSMGLMRLRSGAVLTSVARPPPARALSTTPTLLRTVSKGQKKILKTKIEQRAAAAAGRATPASINFRRTPFSSVHAAPPKLESKINWPEVQRSVRHHLHQCAPTPEILNSAAAKKWPKRDDIMEYMTKQFERFTQILGFALRKEMTVVDSSTKLPSPKILAALVEEKNSADLRDFLWRSYLYFIGFQDTNPTMQRMQKLEAAADFRFPQEWYPSTRMMQRTWHLHIGPTNSGKTYHALKRLEGANSGIYAGPLRLLAHEVYERLNAKGIPCDLMTGDDVRITGEDGHRAPKTSSTVEMVNTTTPVEVCVLDEIQMIGDEERGWAWTEALLGVRAQEVHMCGEERTASLIKALAESTGDKLIIHRYTRLGPLKVQDDSLNGDLSQIQTGDCVVAFSRKKIFALKKSIEQETGKRCAIIYGSLPPETRSAQAALFNEHGNEYEVLVASDAIGMGLNLSVKRIIFESMHKFDGEKIISIPVPSVKQIAGRAGRFKVAPSIANPNAADDASATESQPKLPSSTPEPPSNQPAIVTETGSITTLPEIKPTGPPKGSTGYCTTLEPSDLPALRVAMGTDPHPILTAGILPQSVHIIRFATQYPTSTPFSQILSDFVDFMKTSGLFHVCSFRDQIDSARIFDDLEELTTEERMIFIMAPIGKQPAERAAAKAMAKAVAKGTSGSVLDIPGIDIEALDKVPESMDELQRLESLHKVLVCYIWLSYRFQATFTPREIAEEIKLQAEEMIQDCLNRIRYKRKNINSVLRAAPGQNARKKAMRQLKEMEESAVKELTEGEPDSLSPQKMHGLDITEPPEDEVEEIEIFGGDGWVSAKEEKAKKALVICHNCGQNGHYKDECPKKGGKKIQGAKNSFVATGMKKIEPMFASSMGVERDTEFREKFSCHRCGGFGHNAKDCVLPRGGQGGRGGSGRGGRSGASGPSRGGESRGPKKPNKGAVTYGISSQ